MKKHWHIELFAFIVTLVYIALFTYTGLDKLLGIQEFRKAIDAQVFPASWTGPITWGIPILELVITGLLIVPRTNALGRFAGTALMLAFTIYTGIGANGLFPDNPCGCAGLFRSLSWWEHFAINMGILLLGVLAVAGQRLSKIKGGDPPNNDIAARHTGYTPTLSKD